MTGNMSYSCFDEKCLPQWFNSMGIYYGYIILAVGTLGICCSMPGQTVGISVFSEQLMAALDLSRSRISFAYLCGTITSSFLLPLAGRCLDSIGPRIFSIIATVSLLACVIYFSFCDSIYSQISGLLGNSVTHEYIAFAVVYVGFLAIRQFGQGWMTMGPRTMIASFFDRKRGRMMALSGMGVAFTFGVTPVLFEMLITTFGWRNTLRYCLATYIIFVAIIAAIFFRRNPEDCGLLIDGFVAPTSSNLATQESPKDTKRHFTAGEALKTRAFWIYALGMCVNALIVTANTFHISYTATLNGVSTRKAFSVFFPAALLSTSTDLAAGFLQEYLDMRVLLATMNLSMIVFITGIIHFNHEYGWWLMAIGQGIAGGMFAQLNGVAFPTLYGTKHLGSISGNVMALIVAGSALGPYTFTLNGGGGGDKELYNRNLALLAILPATCLLLAPFASPPISSEETAYASIGAHVAKTPENESPGGEYQLVRMEESSQECPGNPGNPAPWDERSEESA